MTYGIYSTPTEAGYDMILAAEIGYWAECELDGQTLVVTGDNDGTDTQWPVRITPVQMARAHAKHIFHREGIKGVHPSNYGWVSDIDDYDADTTDWVVQFLCFGEVVYG